MPKDSTRSKYLAAGMALMIEDGMHVLNRGLNLERVAEQAGTSSGNYYRYFPRTASGKAKFIDDLVVALASSPSPVADELTEKIVNSFAAAEGDPLPVIREVCLWDFTTIREHNSVLHALAALVLARNQKKAMKALGDMYHVYDRLIVDAIDAVLAKWGASLRKPFTPELLAIALTAVVEGLTLRWLATPKDVPDELFGETVVALVAAVFDVEQSHEHIDDVAALLANAVKRQFQIEQRDTLPDDPYQAVIDAALHEFEKRGYFATTLTHISNRAGVSREDLNSLFPSKADIVTSALQDSFRKLQRKIETDIKLQRNEIDIVLRHLTQLALFAKQNSVMTKALLAVVASDTAQPPPVASQSKQLDLPGIIAPIIEAGQEKGVFSKVTQPYELAAILTNMLLHRCFTRPTDEAKELAGTISSILLGGILVQK